MLKGDGINILAGAFSAFILLVKSEIFTWVGVSFLPSPLKGGVSGLLLSDDPKADFSAAGFYRLSLENGE